MQSNWHALCLAHYTTTVFFCARGWISANGINYSNLSKELKRQEEILCHIYSWIAKQSVSGTRLKSIRERSEIQHPEKFGSIVSFSDQINYLLQVKSSRDYLHFHACFQATLIRSLRRGALARETWTTNFNIRTIRLIWKIKFFSGINNRRLWFLIPNAGTSL